MSTARIVALTVAHGVNGLAASLAGEFENKPAGPAEPISQKQAVGVLVPNTRAPRPGITAPAAHHRATAAARSERLGLRPEASISVADRRIASQTTTQK